MSYSDKHLRLWETAALITLCVLLLSGLWAREKQASIAAQLVRLHVLAVSDEPAEQAVKLRVRDAESAGAILSDALEGIRAAAEGAAAGRSVRVTLDEERYPTREYAGFSLPAGRYRSLRVVLGEGLGHNWWCVVFPPVCLSAVQREAMRPVMNPEDYALITREDGWELRFRIVELWGELLKSLECGV